MRAILLAAGMGRRLTEASGGIAKALVEAAGLPLVVHQLRTLERAGFKPDEVVVVTGCDGDRVAEAVRAENPQATVLHNDRFTDQNLLSLLTARTKLSAGFLLVNVDHLMPHAVHQKLMAAPGTVVAAVDTDRTLTDDDMKVSRGPDGRIAAISKQLTEWDCGYIGMTRVDASMVEHYLATADRVLSKIGAKKAVVEMVLAGLSEAPSVCDCSGVSWAEVDTPDELAAAEDLLNSRPDFFEQTPTD
jgi:choline kinase